LAVMKYLTKATKGYFICIHFHEIQFTLAHMVAGAGGGWSSCSPIQEAENNKYQYSAKFLLLL
ncbi:hypothetical protein ACQP3L_34835, partial [Escherichia coli]